MGDGWRCNGGVCLKCGDGGGMADGVRWRDGGEMEGWGCDGSEEVAIQEVTKFTVGIGKAHEK